MWQRIIIMVCSFCFQHFVKAQMVLPQTINSGGGSKAAGSILLEDAVGGFIVTTITSPGIIYTQDFFQPFAGTTNTPPILNNVILNTGNGIDNAGTTFIAGNILLEFTTGEFASITLNSASNMLTQGILQPLSSGSALPVTGLEFYAKRISNTQVQLDWKTIQEINNKGFTIERKKENENNFAAMGFVRTNATGGNSTMPLQYQKTDNNNFAGISYYRLRQEDIDGRTSYSVTRVVRGDVSKQLTMQVWPVPAVGFFNVSVSGLDKPDVVQVLDMNGRLVKQFTIQNNMQQQVNGLPAGTYYIKLASDKTVGQKVVVQ